MSNRWQVQSAKARFSEFLERTLDEGPQIVTRRGIETARVGARRAMASPQAHDETRSEATASLTGRSD